MNKKEMLLMEDNTSKLKYIFPKEIDINDFSLLELYAYKFLSRQYPNKIEKYTFVYNQITPINIKHLGRDGELIVYFTKYSIYLIAVLNAAKLLGIDITFVECNKFNNRRLSIR